MKYAEVVLLRQTKRIDKMFTYAVPKHWQSVVHVGTKVQVPFGTGNQTHEAIVTGFMDEQTLSEKFALSKVKPITAICDDEPWLDQGTVQLALWLRETYVASYSEAFSLFMPAGTRLKRDYELVLVDEPPLIQPIEIHCFEKINREKKTLLSHFTETMEVKLINQWIKQGFVEKAEHLYTDVEDVEKYFIDLALPLAQAEAMYRQLPEWFAAQRRLLSHVMIYGRTEEGVLRQLTGSTTVAILKFVEQGWFLREKEVVLKLPEHHEFSGERLYEGLSSEQQQVFDVVAPQIASHEHETYLLHGVTGSGKTEVYMEWADLALQMGKQALMMVPEISLTPQMIDRFRRRFGDQVAVFHSKLGIRQRYDQWQAVKQGKLPIVIGARSAIFAPLFNPGIIIVDEAHEASYKSETTPKYNGVDMAIKLGEIYGAPVILGSATPTVSHFYAAQTGQLSLLKMLKRFNETELPSVDLVDMREELTSGNRSIFSRRLHEKMVEALQKNQQIMLLMNRKGFSTYVACRSCGFTMKCPDCEIALTYHKGASYLRCNYCNYRVSIPKTCPSCNSPYFKHFGTGTEKVLEETAKVFPGVTIDRLDSETVSKRGELEDILERFENGETRILIGTQMISKGLDFKNVGLVGVIAADLTLNLPDYHAPERTFSLLTQVAGRAGRGLTRGHVVVQTYEPDHYAILATMKHDFETFYKDEIRIREAFKYPPFFEMASILVTSPDAVEVQKAIAEIYQIFKSSLSGCNKSDYELLEANPAVYAKIKNRYRWQIVIKYRKVLSTTVIEGLRKSCFEDFKRKNYSDYLRIIVDPQAQSIL